MTVHGAKQRIQLAILVALGVVLALLVVTRGVVGYLADYSPETAIYVRATEPTALVNLAQKKLDALKRAKLVEANKGQQSPDTATQIIPPPNSDQGSRTRAEIGSLAEQALVTDPLNASALSILGQLSALAADNKRADTFMQAAVRRSLFESDAVLWMMKKSYDTHDYNAAIGYADTLLRTRQNVGGYVWPMLGNLAENPMLAAELRKLLASQPPWRDLFFHSLSGNISDARTPLEIFLNLKNTGAPPTAVELRSYLNFLVARKSYDLAYYAWLQFLPAAQLNQVGNLFNGSFEFDPSGLPFDWVWTDSPAVTIKIEPSDDEKERALHIQFGPGRVDFSGVSQLIMLPPGNYQFQGKYKADILSQRGMQWRISCAAGESTPLGESSMVPGRGSTWQDLVFSFSVPEADCPAQYVTLASLARSASEQFISGTIWCDDLKIVNETVVAPSAGPL